MNITDEQLERIGQLADKADNFLTYADSAHGFAASLSTTMRFEALKTGLTELRDELRAAVVEIGGEDPWN
jgi:hypothetical protein